MMVVVNVTNKFSPSRDYIHLDNSSSYYMTPVFKPLIQNIIMMQFCSHQYDH